MYIIMCIQDCFEITAVVCCIGLASGEVAGISIAAVPLAVGVVLLLVVLVNYVLLGDCIRQARYASA